MAEKLTTIEISKDYLHFNSAHFTIFSASQREDLHGHTFYVKALIESPVGEDGLAFDYNLLKDALKAQCDGIDEKVLLPERSPYLQLSQEGGYLIAAFADEKLPFLPRDVITLPIANITVEELAPWFLDTLMAHPVISDLDLRRIEIRVSSGPGQWAAAVRQSAQQHQPAMRRGSATGREVSACGATTQTTGCES